MNLFYKVDYMPYGNTQVESVIGVCFGSDEGEIMNKICEAYSDVGQVSFWFGENFDSNMVEELDIKECPFFNQTRLISTRTT